MKKILLTLLAIATSFVAMAQKTAYPDSSCGFLKNLNFKNRIDTVEIKVAYNDFLKGSDESILKILSDQKKLQYTEYACNSNGTNSMNFTPLNCKESFEGTLSRKVYDKTFIGKSNSIKKKI